MLGKWRARFVRLAIAMLLASILGEGQTCVDGCCDGKVGNNGERETPFDAGIDLQRSLVGVGKEEILCADYVDVEDGQQLEQCLLDAAGLLEHYYISRQRVAVVLSSSECGIDRTSLYSSKDQEQNRDVIHIYGLARSRQEFIEARMQSENENAADHGARTAVMRGVGKMVADGTSDVHVVQLALLRDMSHQADTSSASPRARGSGRFKGKCYIHGYSCLPGVTDEDLDFALHEVGCEMLTRPRGLGLLQLSLDFPNGGLTESLQYEAYNFPLTGTTLHFPSNFNQIEISWRTWRGFSQSPFSAWPPKARCTIRVDHFEDMDSVAPEYTQSQPAAREVAFECEESLAPLLECGAMGNNAFDEDSSTHHMSVMLDCRILLSLPIPFFGIGHQKLSMTITGEPSPTASSRQLQAPARMRVEADVEGLKFVHTRVGFVPVLWKPSHEDKNMCGIHVQPHTHMD